MPHTIPPPPPETSQYSLPTPTTDQKRSKTWLWLVGILGAFALGGAVGYIVTPEPEVITEEVEPADVGERRAELDTLADQLDVRETQLDTRQTELDEQSEALEQQAKELEEAQAEHEAAVEAAAEETPEPEDKTSFPGSGTFLVGEDIEPGTYATDGGSGMCYWARLSGLSGEFDDIITNGIPDGQGYVTIAATDVAFETTSCGTWVLQ